MTWGEPGRVGRSARARHFDGRLPMCQLNPRESPWKGRALVVLAALLWSTSGFFAKAPWLTTWPVAERGLVLAFWRALAAGVVLLPFVRRPTWTPGLIPAGLSFAVMNGAFLMALTQAGESSALWLQYTSPLWVFLIGVRFLHEPWGRGDVGMVGCVLLGTGIILTSQFLLGGNGGHRFTGTIWGLVSGLALSGVFLSLRRLRDHESVWLVTVCHFCAAVCLAPWVLTRSVWPTLPQWLWLTLFGALQMAIPYVLFTRGLRHIPAHEASCLALLEPIFVSVWVYLAWGHRPEYQPPSGSTLAGGACILAGLLIRYTSTASVPRQGAST